MRQPISVNCKILTHYARNCESAGSEFPLIQSHAELMVDPI
jgi:hypothetical protein